jgi:hypothetical protein
LAAGPEGKGRVRGEGRERVDKENFNDFYEFKVQRITGLKCVGY